MSEGPDESVRLHRQMDNLMGRAIIAAGLLGLTLYGIISCSS